MRDRLTQRPICLGKDMRPQSEFEQEVAELIVESLNLEDIGAAEIDPAPGAGANPRRADPPAAADIGYANGIENPGR